MSEEAGVSILPLAAITCMEALINYCDKNAPENTETSIERAENFCAKLIGTSTDFFVDPRNQQAEGLRQLENTLWALGTYGLCSPLFKTKDKVVIKFDAPVPDDTEENLKVPVVPLGLAALALLLVACDGPLPFGDAAALGLMASLGLKEAL